MNSGRLVGEQVMKLEDFENEGNSVQIDMCEWCE